MCLKARVQQRSRSNYDPRDVYVLEPFEPGGCARITQTVDSMESLYIFDKSK